MQEQTIFTEALEKEDTAERAAFLEGACAGDSHLRQRIERLLGQHDHAGSFLEQPVMSGDAITDHQLPISEQPGSVIGPYKLLQQIGEGGMGVVFMAEQTEPIQRTVALKIIKPGMDTRQVIARFEAERQALAMMDHPNIARVIDAGTTTTGRPYFVMDLVKGVPITEYCDVQHLPVRERLELMATVCHAVQHAHQKGIIHRDLKPSNVLVAEYDGRPVPKIIDFGVAKATAQRLTERTMFTEYGQLVGTFEYMSPEQARFNQLDVDTRSDIYSLGVLLYEVLAGSTPLEKERLRSAAFDEVLRIICEEEPPRPSLRVSASQTLPSISAQRQIEPATLTKLVRGELDWIVMKCLEKDRNRRYETASALAIDLHRYLNDEPVEARPSTQAYRLKKFIRRNKSSVVTGALVFTALSVGLILASVGLVQARRHARIAKAEADKATAVSNLLQAALLSADPFVSKSRDYTVRELFSDISASLGNKLADQPEVEMELRTIIGSTYRGMGDFASAEPHMTRAVELARRIYGPNDEKLAAVLIYYTQNLCDRKHYAEAEATIREALRIYRSHQEWGQSYLGATIWLHLVLFRSGRIPEAKAVAQEALAIADANGKEYPETAGLLHNLAKLISTYDKDYLAAEKLGRRAVDISRRLDGPESHATAIALLNLGGPLFGNQKYAESERAYRDALIIFRRTHAPSHWTIHYSLAGLTKALKAQDKDAAVEELENEQREWAAVVANRREVGDLAVPQEDQSKLNSKPSTLDTKH